VSSQGAQGFSEEYWFLAYQNMLTRFNKLLDAAVALIGSPPFRAGLDLLKGAGHRELGTEAIGVLQMLESLLQVIV
jgi:hypothetical protein